MKSLMTKKGDVTITTVILIVLGLVVLVMLIIGFTKGTGFFFGAFDKGPSELQTLAKACEGYVTAGLLIDFCSYRLLDVAGDDELVNCNDARIKTSLSDAGVSPPSNYVNCPNNVQNQRSACQKLSETKRKSINVATENGLVSCETLVAGTVAQTGRCEGTVALCSTRTAQNCVALKGCTLTGTPSTCTGTATDCTDAQFNTQSLCLAQTGCEWKTTPAA